MQIVGRVIDRQTARPLRAATAKIRGRQEQFTTDSTGTFTLTVNLPAGNQVLDVMRIGYQRAEVLLSLNQTGTLNLFDIAQLNQHVTTTPPLREPIVCRVVRTAPAIVAANEEIREARDSTGLRWHICEW